MATAYPCKCYMYYKYLYCITYKLTRVNGRGVNEGRHVNLSSQTLLLLHTLVFIQDNNEINMTTIAQRLSIGDGSF